MNSMATAVNGAQCLSGALQEGDQDIFLWQVSEADASQQWNLSVQGLPTGVTGAQLLRITFAENGTDVAESQKLFALDATDGELVESGPLLLLPGDYYIGLSAAGGEGDYQFAMQPLAALPCDAGSTYETSSALPAFSIPSKSGLPVAICKARMTTSRGR